MIVTYTEINTTSKNKFMMKIDKEQIIKNIEVSYLSKNSAHNIEVGDTIKIGVLIQEGNKERVQFSEGVIICMHKAGVSTTITIRRVLQGIGVEKVYLLNSPRITSIQVLKKARVKKAKLYYLRSKAGKATRLKQKFNS